MFDAELARSVSEGAFEPTQRHDSVAPRALSEAATAPWTEAPSTIVVSPEISPQRLEITETRPAFARTLPLLALGVVLVGLAIGAVVAIGFVLGAGTDRDDASTLVAPAVPDVVTLDAALLDAGSRAQPDAFADLDAFVEVDASADPDAFVQSDAHADPDAFVDVDAFVVRAHLEGPSNDPPTRAPRTGRIEVVVAPWGRVEIDGTDVGRSPFRGEVPTGTHTIVGVAGDQRRARTVRVTGRGVARVSIAIE